MNREVKASAKLDKESYTEGRTEQMEEAERRETDTVSKSTNELCGKKTCSVLIKGKDGKVLASEREQADSWKSHF